MPTPPDIICKACKMTPYPPDAPLLPETGLPKGWVTRKINGNVYTLCDCCGDIMHFKGGISAYLQENLGVPEYATCEFDEHASGSFFRNRTIR